MFPIIVMFCVLNPETPTVSRSESGIQPCTVVTKIPMATAVVDAAKLLFAPFFCRASVNMVPGNGVDQVTAAMKEYMPAEGALKVLVGSA